MNFQLSTPKSFSGSTFNFQLSKRNWSAGVLEHLNDAKLAPHSPSSHHSTTPSTRRAEVGRRRSQHSIIPSLHCSVLLLVLSTINSPLSTFSQGTAFTYQGRLTDGTNAANGRYDLTFSVLNASR